MDESKESIMLETDVGNPSDVLPNRNLDDSSARNSVSEDLALIMGESKEAIMLETDDGNPSDVVSHIVELESFEQTSPVPEAFASPHGDMSEECTKLEDKREEETSEESSVTAEKMSLSPLHHECFCITLEANANKLSDFDWLQENSHTSEALVCPLNDGRKLGIVLERELSVMLPEKTKDESSEGNYLTQASAPPQNYKNEHSNTLENAEIESGNTENEEDKNIAEESLTIVDSRMSEDGIQIVEDCEGMEKVVSSGKCLHHKTSSKKEVEGNLKEMSNIFSMTLTIDDSKDIQVPEFCLSDEEEPENDLNNTLDLVNTIMLEHLYQSCSPSKLADLKRSIQHSVAAAQHRHDTVNLISDDDYSFTDYDDDHGGGENEERDDNKGSVETSYCRNVDPVLDVLKVDKAGSDCNSFNESSHEENRNDVAVSNNFEEHASSGQKGIERKSPDVELPVKCPSKFDYSSLKVKRRSPASREKHFQKSPCQKVLHASTPRYRALESPLQSYLRSEPTLIQIVKPKFKTPRNIKNFCCLEAAPDVTSPKESSVYPKRSLISPNTLPVVRYRSHPTVDINGPGTPIAATGPCEKVPGAITPIVTKHIGHVKIVNSGSPLKLAEPRLSIVQSSFAGRSDTLGGHTEASGKLSPSKFVGHRIPILKPNPAGRADMLLGKSKKEGVVGSKTELTPKRRGEL
ncbi:uncharacterized protein [Anabrus simplex]|uniref:uncharacterized protein n=1 Tax=Anabrus simplex TaxID=316456 RepID=UPI0035A2EA28